MTYSGTYPPPIAGIPGYGSAPAMKSGYYYPVPAGGQQALNSLGVGSLRLSPVYLPRGPILRMGAEVTVIGDVGSTFRLAMYADDGTGVPGALVVDGGSIAGDVVGVQTNGVTAVAIQPGLYWVGGAVQNVSVTQPTMRCGNGAADAPPIVGLTGTPGTAAAAAGYLMAGVTGALPTTFVATNAGIVPRIYLQA